MQEEEGEFWFDADLPLQDLRLSDDEEEFSDDEQEPDQVPILTAAEARERFALLWSGARASSRANHAQAAAFFQCIKENWHTLSQMGPPETWPCYRTIQRAGVAALPEVTMTHTFIDKEDDDKVIPITDTVLPAKRFSDLNRYELKRTWSRITLVDAMKVLDQIHGVSYASDELNPWKTAQPGLRKYPIDISYDGVLFEKSNGKVLEILSIRSLHCDRIIPIGKFSFQ